VSHIQTYFYKTMCVLFQKKVLDCRDLRNQRIQQDIITKQIQFNEATHMHNRIFYRDDN